MLYQLSYTRPRPTELERPRRPGKASDAVALDKRAAALLIRPLRARVVQGCSSIG